MALCFATFTVAEAQRDMNSPYSYYGLGEPVLQGHVRNLSMGNTRYANTSKYQFNSSNPALYSSLEATVFEAGIFLNTSIHSNGSATQQNDDAGFNYFGLAFPISKRWGWAAGLVPLTRVSYSIENEFSSGNDVIQSNYTGKGGISQLYSGVSFDIIEDSTNQLSVGANIRYTFGPLQYERSNSFAVSSNGGYSSVLNERQNLSGILFDIGTYYKKELFIRKKSQHWLALGATIGLPGNIRTRYSYLAASYQNISVKDTAIFNTDTVSTQMPLRFGFGLCYEILGKGNKSRLTLAADYEFTQWSSFKRANQPLGLELGDAWNASFGLQFIPNDQNIRQLFKYMQYRTGFRYGNTRILQNGKPMTEFGISFGFGLPLVKSKSVHSTSTSLNFGVETGRRGNNVAGLISEQFTHYVFGVTLTPSFWDRWFQRRKLD
jgi:hypothetical protein